MMKLGILTSSRADYGIYLPLLKALSKDPFFELKIIAFGTHLSPFHGYTISQILNDGFRPAFRIESMITGDTPNAVASAMSLTSLKFADFWENNRHDFDLVFCLGDRYEMFSAVVAGIPYGVKFAHIHGGEETLGSIDNIFRHTISLTAKYHFVSCEDYGKRVEKITGSGENIINVGALSLDNLESLKLLTKDEFQSAYGVNLDVPTILTTVHPETVFPFNNEWNISELIQALTLLEEYHVVITLPNADTDSQVIREALLQFASANDTRVHCFENLGTQGYFTAMKYCSLLLGNTSSGIIEAASFGKYVINLGRRQNGRQQSGNTINVPFNQNEIIPVVKKLGLNSVYKGINIYNSGNAANAIVEKLKTIGGEHLQ